jgi:hypothetical protein
MIISQQQNTIAIKLNESFSFQNREEIKNLFLKKIEPIKISLEKISPTFKKQNITTAVFSLENLHSIEDVKNAIKEAGNIARDILPKYNRIQNIDKILLHSPLNKQLILEKGFLLAKLNKIDIAKLEIKKLIDTFNCPEAQLFYNLIDREPRKLEKMNNFNYVFLLKWKQETPEDTDIEMIAIIDDKKYILKPYDPNGVVLPIKFFNKLSFGVKLISKTGRYTPILYLGVEVLITFNDLNNSPNLNIAHIMHRF